MGKKKKINIKINNLKLTNTQEEIFKALGEEQYKYIVCNISRQQGKSILAKLMVSIWLTQPNNEICYMTPKYKLAKKFFYDLIKILKPSGLIKSSNASENLIESITGSKLTFYSSESADTVRGETFTHLIMDEAAFYKEEIDGQTLWQILQPTIKVRGKKVLIISTPLGKDGFFYDMYCRALENRKYYKLIEKTIYEDGLVTPEQIKEIKGDLTEKQFNQEYLVQFITGSLSYFDNYEKNFIKLNYNDKLPQWIGLDFSGNGGDETILTFVNSLNQTIQYKINGSLDDKYKKISELLKSNKNTIVGGLFESNSIGAVMGNEILKLLPNDLKKKIEFINTSNDSKKDYLDLLQMSIDKDEVWFDIDDKELFVQFGVFHYSISKTKKITFNAKAGYHDDRIISMSLANKAKHTFKDKSSISYSIHKINKYPSKL